MLLPYKVRLTKILIYDIRTTYMTILIEINIMTKIKRIVLIEIKIRTYKINIRLY